METKIKSLHAQGATSSPAYDQLVATRGQFQAFDALLAHQTRVQQAAERAFSFRPHALRNGIIGGLLGALPAIALVAVIGIWPKNGRSQTV